MSINKLESLKEAASRLGLSRQRLQQLAKSGKIPGAIRIGHYWAIPATWQPPARQRGEQS